MTGKLTKSQSKYIKSLQQKKYRDLNRQFVVEGEKMVSEALAYSNCVDFVVFENDKCPIDLPEKTQSYNGDHKTFSQASGLKTPAGILCVCNFPDKKEIDFTQPIIVLDGVRDPGNLGTIIRICDWFGLSQLVCSNDSVDVFNPKVVQSTMGSLFRVVPEYMELSDLLDKAPGDLPVFVADMEGDSLYETKFSSSFILVFGSESHGPGEDMLSRIQKRITIPRFGKSESLNVGVSVGIFASEIRKQLPV